MADPPSFMGGPRRHLDAAGPRAVVFCHTCKNDWYQDEHDLICPQCGGEATEIVAEENDPRSLTPDPADAPGGMPQHHPWPDDDVPDPEEGDLDEFLNHATQNSQRGPAGRTTFFSHTFTTRGGPGASHRPNAADNDPSQVIQNFHEMIGQLMGPNVREGPAGRSGQDALFNRHDPFGRAGPLFGGVITTGTINGPQITRSRYTVTANGVPVQQRDANLAVDDFATYASPPPVPSRLSRRSPRGPTLIAISITAPPDQLASILGSIFGQMAPVEQPGGPHTQRVQGPPGLQGLLASIFNPANAVAGDAVYSQEALDRIISTLMEQHPTSNAPGPASAEAIANLPKKKVDEKMLGPEFKAECSVCMDDVKLDDEVVVLPCSHWFHETCASAWLSEHNTCPICRTGIGGESSNQEHNNTNSLPSPIHNSIPNPFAADTSNPFARRASFPYRMPRNEARLESNRDRGRLSSMAEGVGRTRRHQTAADPSIRLNRTRSPSPPHMLGSFTASNQFRRRDSQNDMSETQREPRRAPTPGSEESRRRSHSGVSSGSGGPMGWWRRFSGVGGSSRRRNDSN